MQDIGLDDAEPVRGTGWLARSAMGLHGPHPVDPLQEMAGALGATGVGIVITDADLTIVAVNDGYADAMGVAAADLCATPLDGEPAACARTAVPCEQEVTLNHRDGRRWPAWMRVDALRGDGGEVRRYVFTFTDISVLEREQDVLRHQAQHDALTGLPNRALRTEDFVARLGGDGFIAVTEDLRSAADAVAVAQGLLSDLAPPFAIDGHGLHVSASIRVVLYPRDASDAAGLMRAADAAMYLAKRNGRARIQLCAAAADTGDGPSRHDVPA